MSFCQMFGCLLLGRRRVDSHVWVSPLCGALIAPYARFSSAGVLRQRWLETHPMPSAILLFERSTEGLALFVH